jgi:hypothetical protein
VNEVCVAEACDLEPRFGAVGNIPVGKGPADLAAADFNGDEVVDVAVALASANTVELLFNAGGALLTIGDAYPVQEVPDSIAAIDANDDGWPDLVVGSSLADEVRLLINQGGGSFADGPAYETPTGPALLRAYDIDNDGLDDLVYVETRTDRVAIRLGDGLGNFSQPLITPVGPGARGLKVAHLDNDGHVDLVVATQAGATVGWGFGNGRFELDEVTLPGTGSVTPAWGNDTLAVADMDGDDNLDVVTYVGTDRIGFLHNAGARKFESTEPLFSDAMTGPIVVSDFDADGSPDVALAYSTASTVRVLLNGSQQSSERYPVGLRPVSLMAADLTGDDKPELISADFDSRSVSILTNNGSGVFPHVDNARRSITSVYSSLYAADWNGDGAADLGVTSSSDWQNFSGRGDGTFTESRGDAWFTKDATVIGHLDADELPDVVTLQQVGTKLRVLFGSGAVDDYDISWGRQLVGSDFNGDGYQDVAVFAELNIVLVLLNRGDGKLLPAVVTEIEDGTRAVAAADLDGDGASEIIGANGLSQPIVWLNRGAGSFDPPTVLAEVATSSFTIGDFNGDDAVDVVSWELGLGMHVFLNDGSASFADAHFYPELGGPGASVTADFDSNGALDIAGIGGGETTITLFLGAGDGSFRTSQLTQVGSDPFVLATADFNTDGRADLAMLRREYPDLVVLLNTCKF